MEETFAQIEGAAAHSVAGVNVSIADGGAMTGNGITASGGNIDICGGNIDSILRSFGGIEGGDTTFGGKASSVVKKTSKLGSKLSSDLEKELKHVHEEASDIEALASLAKSALKQIASDEAKKALQEIIDHMDSAATEIRKTVSHEVKLPKENADAFVARNGQFVRAIKSLGAHLNDTNKAAMMSLSFSSVNELKKLGKEVSDALKTVHMKKKEYLGSPLSKLDAELTKKLTQDAKKLSSEKTKEFIKAWSTLMKNHGHKSEIQQFIGGSSVKNLADRLNQSREELKSMNNKFIDAFGINVNGMASSAEILAKSFGKSISYGEDTVVFLETFGRLSEYLNANTGKIYQHLLELNEEQIDSKEIKMRFLSSMRDLAERAEAVSGQTEVKTFAQHCRDIVSTVNRFSDMIKSHRESMRKEGGSTDTMNDLFSVDASKIDITGLLNPLDNLKLAIRKITFFRNIAVFRSNLSQTNKELATYSKDYTKSVGQAIGEAINKIKNEYTEIMNQVSDNKAGMGLEIDMYNESQPSGMKISKEKLKMMYKWQCDARIGLYKTVEAIDLYLLHFTDAVSKNPDAVADLHKLLSATRIIAKWYDEKAGDNLIRAFESFADTATDEKLDKSDFVAKYVTDPAQFADLEQKVGGERAMRIYERCRRAVEGVVVLKNVISYFVTISEKYGDFKSEKNIYMAPSNIYKNLVNYIWVSAVDMNTTGSEILTDNNETKRLLTYEDTKIKMAGVTSIDPETLGINFNRHAIDKLRILKTHNELLRLKDFTASLSSNHDLQRLKQFVASTFARLGKTKYIFHMMYFGLYDFKQMDKDLMAQFFKFLSKMVLNPKLAIKTRLVVDISGIKTDVSDTKINQIVDDIFKLPPVDRNGVKIIGNLTINGAAESLKHTFVSLDEFMGYEEKDLFVKYSRINAMLTHIPSMNTGNLQFTRPQALRTGFLSGFLVGLTGNTRESALANTAARSIGVLHYCVMQMLNQYKTEQSSSVFAIDNTYFVLTIKAIAGKIMAVAGINTLFKNPKSYSNTIMQNQTRLIMGGAEEGDVDVIDEAVELYVRLPLLVEFYRAIFDDANKEYKQESASGVFDEERISFVPEIGNIWSGLIISIFDKSRHIEACLFTAENMRKIVSEINSIYKHYKGSVPADRLVRHVMLELVAEVNRRYGVIKRQELLQYYRTLNATKRRRLDVGESNYTNNDLDILNEAIEFEEKAPSDDFIKFKASLTDPLATTEQKINKLTDYKILKEFRERVQQMFSCEKLTAGAPDDRLLSMRERIRMLKRAITNKSSRTEKYDMIIKAIEESESMNQSSNDIFACFLEFVITPLRTLFQMYKALDVFMLTSFAITAAAASDPDPRYADIANHRILQTQVKIGGADVSLKDAIAGLLTDTSSVKSEGKSYLLISGRNEFAGLVGNQIMKDDLLAHNGLLQDLLFNTFVQFSSNSGSLVKMDVSQMKRISIDLSEYQKVCEHLIANVKYMIDKFTGLVPTSLIEKVLNSDDATGKNGVLWIENKLINHMFNKLNKSEADRDLICIDNLNKLLPVMSDIVFKTKYNPNALAKSLFLHPTSSDVTPGKVPLVFNIATDLVDILPMIRDAFTEYASGSKSFVLTADSKNVSVSKLLFDCRQNASFGSQQVYGLVQQYNIAISQYLKDLYDAQNRKIYIKAFANFAGSTLVDVLNGNSFVDFDRGTAIPDTHFSLPSNGSVFSSTLAYVMKVMTGRVNPESGVKVHELSSLQDVSPHMLEKYRAVIPIHMRVFKSFLARLTIYRKFIAKIELDGKKMVDAPDGNPSAGKVRENESDQLIDFTNRMKTLGMKSTDTEIIDALSQYLDEMINGVSSLLTDINAVQKELLETDSAVPLYFDVKKDFTKNYLSSSKELPFAPLSVLAMGFKLKGNAVPFYTNDDAIKNKFLYGLRSLLMHNFDISSTNIPYLKKLISDFNGYATKANQITDAKFNDVLKYVGVSMNYLYDLRFFNGKSLTHVDLLSNHKTRFGAMGSDLITFQEMKSKSTSLSLVESVGFLESRNKVADYVKQLSNPSTLDDWRLCLPTRVLV